MQRAAELLSERHIAHRRWGRRIDCTSQLWRRYDMCDQAHEIVALDPRHPLPPAAHRSAKSELKRGEQAAKHAVLDTEHEPDAQPNHPHAKAFRFARRALPRLTQAMAEATLAAVKFCELLIAPRAVPADGGAADEHRRPSFEPLDQTDQRARDSQP